LKGTKKATAAERKATIEAAWTIVRKENSELRKSHPKVYAWARAYIDSVREI
jgi:hypothetical protein